MTITLQETQITASETSLTSRLLYTLLSFFITFLLYQAYVLRIRAYLRIRFYQKQGFITTFFPFLGGENYAKKGLLLHNDALYFYKSHNGKRDLKIRATNYGSDVSVMLHDPALIKEFFMKPENYVKDPEFLQLYSPLLGNGMLGADGDAWKNCKKALSKAFQFENIKSIIKTSQTLTKQVLSDAQKSSSCEGFDVTDAFQKITGGVVGTMFFGDDLQSYKINGKPITDVLAQLESDLGLLDFSTEKYYLGGAFVKKGIFPSHRRMMKRVAEFRKTCSDIVQEKKKLVEEGQGHSSNMLDMLLNFADDEGKKLTDQQILDQFVTFLSVGMNNPGHLTSIAVYYLAKNPEYLARIREEVKAIYDSGNEITLESLDKMEFMTAVLKECLRTVSPIPGCLPRRVAVDHKVGEYELKKGDMVEIDFFYNHFHPKFFPEPKKFDPERWLSDFKPTDAYAYTPFSGGKRACLGQHLGMYEARVILSEFVKMYDFKLVDGFELKMNLTFLYEPVDKIKVNLTPLAL